MKKKVAVILGIMMVASIPLTALAQQDDHHPENRYQASSDPNAMPFWARNLPPEQQQALEKIHETRSRTIYPLMMQLRARQAQLMAEVAAEKVNRQNVDQTLKQINDIQARLNREQADLMIEIKDKFPQAMMRGMMMGMGPGMGMMGGSGQGSGMMCPMMGQGGMMGGGGMMGQGGMMGGGMGRGGMPGQGGYPGPGR
jgi:Spy/CpxP family protein refolding chaperone